LNILEGKSEEILTVLEFRGFRDVAKVLAEFDENV
jgi:hypothetical protein